MAKYYTLEEAAQILQTSSEEVRQLAETKTVRAFRDRGSLRFRAEEIDELARQRGLGSDPDLQFGDLPAPKKGPSSRKIKQDSSKSGGSPKKKKQPTQETPAAPPETSDDVFSFALGDDDKGDSNVRIGVEDTPPPGGGSDSEVRLVTDGSDAEIAAQDSTVGKERAATQPAPDSGVVPHETISDEADSGAKLVSMDDSDSDVKIVPDDSDDDIVAFDSSHDDPLAPDSVVRVEQADDPPSSRRDPQVTEEINLDEEIAKEKAKLDESSGEISSALPRTSPFEISEDDMDLDEPPAKKPSRPTQAVNREKKAKPKGKAKPKAKKDLDSSDDFELTPAGTEELDTLSTEDEDVDLGDLSPGSGATSGINLTEPADSGISLEQDESEHEGSPLLSKKNKPVDESSSEFELALDDSSESEFELTLDEEESSEFELELTGEDEEDSSEFDLELSTEDSSSEFELELSAEDNADSSSEFELELSAEDSDSEFELTLDESGDLGLDEDEEKDIFDTDFDVPALEDESGSEAIPLDEDDETDLDDSDFDLALDEDDFDDADSGSQVVALDDDDDYEDGESSTVARPSRRRVLAEEEDELDIDEEWSGLDEDAEVEYDEEGVATRTQVVYRDRPDAPWGILPVIFMVPCLLVLLIVGLMSFEMMQTSWGYKRSTKATNLIIDPLAEAVGAKTAKK